MDMRNYDCVTIKHKTAHHNGTGDRQVICCCQSKATEQLFCIWWKSVPSWRLCYSSELMKFYN